MGEVEFLIVAVAFGVTGWMLGRETARREQR